MPAARRGAGRAARRSGSSPAPTPARAPATGRCVRLGAPRAIPLIHAPVAAALVGGQPQLRDQAGEAGKQGSVEQALPAEQGVTAAAHRSQPELHDQHARAGGGAPVDDRLPVYPPRCAVGEVEPRSYMPSRQVDPPLPQQPCGSRDAADLCAQRRRVRQRRPLRYDIPARALSRARRRGLRVFHGQLAHNSRPFLSLHDGPGADAMREVKAPSSAAYVPRRGSVGSGSRPGDDGCVLRMQFPVLRVPVVVPCAPSSRTAIVDDLLSFT